jgi:hypothetical protein
VHRRTQRAFACVGLVVAAFLMAVNGSYERSMGISTAGASPQRPSHSVTGRAGATVVRLTVEAPHHPSGAVAEFAVSVTVSGPRGALAYRLAFGDGTSSSPPAPQVCRRTTGPAASRTWVVHHHYPHTGTYRVVVTGWAVCTAGRASAALSVTTG